MKTKAQLEERITQLEDRCRRQEEALKALSKEAGVQVLMGGRFNSGSAPYVKPAGAPVLSDDVWNSRVMPVVAAAIRQHGVLVQNDEGFSHESYLDLGRGIYGRSERIVIPRLAGEMIVGLLNAAADFGRECYAAGIRQGTSILKQLAEGKISEDEFEDRVAREKALDAQSHKKYQLNKHSE